MLGAIYIRDIISPKMTPYTYHYMDFFKDYRLTNMKKFIISLFLLSFYVASHAQIGYQVSLLNSATGEPRANETVTCTITLTNAEGTVICSETKSVVSNDFGVLSLSVGNASTFDNVDWSKQPFFVSASVDGNLIGKSQVLTVPVAEYAKRYGTLTYENVHEKKVVSYSSNEGALETEDWVLFGKTAKMTFTTIADDYYEQTTLTGSLRIDGNAVFGILESDGTKYPFIGHYSPEDDIIYIEH